MRVIVEDTAQDNENKRRVVVENENDTINIGETLDMILRGLMAYGYAPEDISKTLKAFAAVQPEPAEEPKRELGEI